MPTRGKYGTLFMDSLQQAAILNSGAIISGSHFLTCPSEGSSEGNPRNLRSSYNVIAVVKFCGFIFGTFVNGGLTRKYKINGVEQVGDHAEDQLMSAWEEFKETNIFQEILQLQRLSELQPYITIKLSRSPCEQCTPKLVNFFNENKINTRLKLLQMYGGQTSQLQHRECLLRLIQTGFIVSLWNVGDPQKGRKTTTKRNLPHELMYYTQLLDTAIQDDEDRTLTSAETTYLSYRTEIIEKLHTLDRFLITYENMDKVTKNTRIKLTNEEVLAIMKRFQITIETEKEKRNAQIQAFRDTTNDRVFFNDVFYGAAKFLPFEQMQSRSSWQIEEDYDTETGLPFENNK